MRTDKQILPVNTIQERIFTILGVQVILDTDLAEMYQVETRILNQAVKRNPERLPNYFMFQLTKNEFNNLLILQFVISSSVHGGRRNVPFVFSKINKNWFEII